MSPSRRQPKQLEIAFRTWGGRRDHSRRKNRRTTVAHVARERFRPSEPLHVTLRLGAPYRNLRERASVAALGAAFRKGCGRGRHGFRLVHFSIQPTHLHLVVEAAELGTLSRGIQGLCVRVARRLNRLFRRRGSVFADRYHARVLRTPREVRTTLVYVLQNARHHRATGAPAPGAPWTDVLSSARLFDGWTVNLLSGLSPPAGEEPPVLPAKSWLLTTGWKRHHGLIDPGEGPVLSANA